eukprot:CAMPEP_0170198482 /NCGR_PEP_ID=MMETSP0040_2-20121228/68796_1 /TAXON_ID=641309 /ORGANISM="Lotharella oceanica, Strain CCMP622" /LENGTH=256 /DNA_ID=CAMNT_0010448475 /DNA_START=77 /DNA_END=847 /DNA_ORIENTATION=+
MRDFGNTLLDIAGKLEAADKDKKSKANPQLNSIADVLQNTCSSGLREISKMKKHLGQVPKKHPKSAGAGIVSAREDIVSDMCEGLEAMSKLQDMKFSEFDFIAFGRTGEGISEHQKLELMRKYSNIKSAFRLKKTESSMFARAFTSLDGLESLFQKVHKQHEAMTMKASDVEHAIVANSATLLSVKSRQDNADKFFTDMLNNYKQETVAERAVNAQLRVQIEEMRVKLEAAMEKLADNEMEARMTKSTCMDSKNQP